MSNNKSSSILSQNQNSRSRGFTLIEIVIVIFIMLLMTTATVPSLKMFADGTKLRTAARSISGLMSYARTSSITERTEYVVLFDPTNRQYWLSLKALLDDSKGTIIDSSRTNLTESLAALEEQKAAEAEANDTTNTSSTSNTSNANSNNQNEVQATRTGGLLGIPKDLPAGIEIVQLNSPRSTSKSDNLDYVNFYPDSKAEDFEVYLQSVSGKIMLISVSESTGRVGIRELTTDEIDQLGLAVSKDKG
jgi:prepilin-type N-terminal cleavage/methylation domain-containing protein